MRKKDKTKKRQKSVRQQYIEKLDEVFSQYIRLRDSDDRGIVECPLCRKRMYWKNAQNMHFISRGVLRYRFDEDNCHAGCYTCNVCKHGNYIEYTRRMQEKYGIEFVDNMRFNKRVYILDTPVLLEMIEEYKIKRDELLKSKIF